MFRFLTTVRERERDFVAATPERLCGLYVIVDKPRLVSDLQEFLRELGFVAAHPRGEGLEVSIPGSPDTAQARRVVNVYLAIWQAILLVPTRPSPNATRACPRRPRRCRAALWVRWPMYVTLRLTDPDERDALRTFLERRECQVEELADDLLRVGLPHELHEQQARLEVDLYLRVWESLHDGRIDIVS